MYILSLVLILNRENLDGEPGNNCYDILKFWPILSLVILIKRILIRNGVLHSANNRNMVHHTIMSRREILKVVLYFPLTYSKARRSVMLSKKKQFFGSRLKHPSQNKPQNNTRFSFYKKVVYKKVYIKWSKIKKVLIYKIHILRNFFVSETSYLQIFFEFNAKIAKNCQN